MERQTKQHHAVYDAITNAGRPLLPKEILVQAAIAVPGISIATIYRNIKSLVNEGRIIAVELPGESSRYEAAGLHHHHHFQCKTCLVVFDIEKCPGDLTDLAPPGFQVEDHEITLYGQCRDCIAAHKKPIV